MIVAAPNVRLPPDQNYSSEPYPTKREAATDPLVPIP